MISLLNKKESAKEHKKTHSNENTYFNRAKSWADDRYTQVETSKARYQAAFLVSMGLNIATILAVSVLATTQKLVPILAHHYDNGVVTIEAVSSDKTPKNKVQIESDIVRYVKYRESYDLSSYRHQYDMVTLLSNSKVSKQYKNEQKASNKASPLNTLGNRITREVHVFNVNFFDSRSLNQEEVRKSEKNHNNTAEVVFRITDIDKDNGKRVSKIYSALVTWGFNKPSGSPDIRWKNWDGFEITSYRKQIRNTQV